MNQSEIERYAKTVLRAGERMRACRSFLEQVSTSCCDPSRSPKMERAFTTIDETLVALDAAKASAEFLPRCLEGTASVGAQIGDLCVTCCTPTRDALYRSIFADLRQTYSLLGHASGRGH